MTVLQDILVVLDNSAPSEIRLAIAVALAQQHDARLTGLSALDLLAPTRSVVRARGNSNMYVQPASPLLNWGAVVPHDRPETDTPSAEGVEMIEFVFWERLQLSRLTGDWQEATGKVSETVVLQARHAST